MKYKKWEVELMVGKYNNGRTALQLMDAEDYQPVATCTVNLPDEKLEEDEAFIKDWSENEGILEWLKTQGIVEEVIGQAQTGFVQAPKVKLNMKKIEELI